MSLLVIVFSTPSLQDAIREFLEGDQLIVRLLITTRFLYSSHRVWIRGTEAAHDSWLSIRGDLAVAWQQDEALGRFFDEIDGYDTQGRPYDWFF